MTTTASLKVDDEPEVVQQSWPSSSPSPAGLNPATFSWGKPAASPSAAASRKKPPPISLAEIMAEESEAHKAAQAAYLDKDATSYRLVTLAEVEAEQERLLRMFQEAKESKPAAVTAAATRALASLSQGNQRRLMEDDRAFSQRSMGQTPSQGSQRRLMEEDRAFSQRSMGQIPSQGSQRRLMEEDRAFSQRSMGPIPAEGSQRRLFEDFRAFSQQSLGPIPSQGSQPRLMEEDRAFSQRSMGPIPSQGSQRRLMEDDRAFSQRSMGPIPSQGSQRRLMEDHRAFSQRSMGPIPSQGSQRRLMEDDRAFSQRSMGPIPSQGSQRRLMEDDRAFSQRSMGPIPSQGSQRRLMEDDRAFSQRSMGPIPSQGSQRRLMEDDRAFSQRSMVKPAASPSAAASRKKPPPISLAEIMAEESEAQKAAQAAYLDEDATAYRLVTMAEVEAEQERLLRLFQEAKESKPAAVTATAPRALASPSQGSQRRLMEDDRAFSQRSMGQTPSQGSQRRLMEEDRAFSQRYMGPIPAQGSQRRLLEKNQVFSQRALEVIERTEVVLDSPHNVQEDKRRRQAAMVAAARPPPSLCWNVAAAAKKEELEEPDWLKEAKHHLSAQEIEDIERALREGDNMGRPSSTSIIETTPDTAAASAVASLPPTESSVVFSEEEAAAIAASLREVEEIERALREADGIGEPTTTSNPETPDAAAISAVASLPPIDSSEVLSEEEAAAIAAALREADAKQEEESFMLALQMQQQELGRLKQQQESAAAGRRNQHPQGNVRTMTMAELELESQRVASLYAGRMLDGRPWPDVQGLLADAMQPPRNPLEEEDHVVDDDEYHVVEDESAGFRMNSAAAHAWARRDRNTIVGPNNEVRTKHDVHVQGQANAHYLGLEEDDFGLRTHVGNQAFNSFKQNMKRTTKGVAAHGTGRAGTDSDAVRGKAMDPHVRLQISKAINSGLIEHCNGAVKQGKEAVVFHAEQGAESQGHDVAVKVFKRVTEFRGRGAYVDGDPRYLGQTFSNHSEREQLEVWAEKEFRNLVRANRAKVPVPTPLHQKENIIFMRFMGNDGWPAPQIRELDMRKGSKKWDVLYTQVLEAIRRLYTGARLVHGDLSEYNILVAPSFQVENLIASTEDTDHDLQAVFIDFGQAVDVRHPEAESWLRRDLERVRSFFVKQGVQTLAMEDALEFVKEEDQQQQQPQPDADGEQEVDDFPSEASTAATTAVTTVMS